MDVEDSNLYIKHLACFVRTHEKALADSLLHQRPSTAPSAGHARRESIASARDASQLSSNSSSSSLFSLSTFGLASKPTRPTRLFLTPNQLYFLLTRFEELGVSCGPMNVRLEDILAESTASNYMSFAADLKPSRRPSADQESIHSVSSVRSVMSSVSTMWSRFSLYDRSAAKADKAQMALLADIKYLYSAFTKIPSLKLAVEPRIRRIAGYEEFPFDTAVPLNVFKNVSSIEIMDTDFRSFYGWDRLADQLRSLTLKRACVEDLADLLTNIVMDDMDGRRWRSSKNANTLVFPLVPSPRPKHAEYSRSNSITESPFTYHRRQSVDLLSEVLPYTPGSKVQPQLWQPRRRSDSPATRPAHSRRPSYKPQKPKSRPRRSSDSSNSTDTPPPSTPRLSTSNLLAAVSLPTTKWRFLRHLSLADNKLSTISLEGLAPIAPTLQSLDLSSNLFVDIPESLASLTSLRALNMANCRIESLRSLVKRPLPAIAVLSVRGNRLTDLVGAERLLSLERLDVRDNALSDPMELARLSDVPNMRDVFVARNPFTRIHTNYRVTIFNAFRKVPGRTEDVTVDNAEPTPKELRELLQWTVAAEQTPVIPKSFEDDADAQHSIDLPAVPAQRAAMKNKDGHEPEAPVLQVADRNANKWKPAKRRIIDLHQDVSRQKTPTSPPVPSLSTQTTPTKSSLRSKSSLTSIARLREGQPSRSPEMAPASGGACTAAVAKDLERASQCYKQSIGALQERASLQHSQHWLEVAGEGRPRFDEVCKTSISVAPAGAL